MKKGRSKRSLTVRRPSFAKQVADRGQWERGREAISEAALQLFLAHGYHGTPVRVIADAAGISVGSVFNYFGGKEEILLRILERGQAEAERAVREARDRMLEEGDGLDPIEFFCRSFSRYLHSIDRIARFTLLAYQETKSLAPEHRVPLFERDRRIADLLKDAARPAIEAGEFSESGLDLKAHCLLVLGQSWAVRRWMLKEYRGVGEYERQLMPVAVSIMRTEIGDDRDKGLKSR